MQTTSGTFGYMMSIHIKHVGTEVSDWKLFAAEDILWFWCKERQMSWHVKVISVYNWWVLSQYECPVILLPETPLNQPFFFHVFLAFPMVDFFLDKSVQA